MFRLFDWLEARIDWLEARILKERKEDGISGTAACLFTFPFFIVLAIASLYHYFSK